MHYILCHNVSYKEINGDFLAYSGQSGETMLLHEYAFKILKYLSQPLSYSALYGMLVSGVLNGGSDIDLDMFLRDTLHQLTERGFITTCTLN